MSITMPARATISVPHIRAAFPALQRRHLGQPVAYFDGPGGTQVPQAVVDAMADYLFHHNANTHWQYPTSEETDALLLRALTWDKPRQDSVPRTKQCRLYQAG